MSDRLVVGLGISVAVAGVIYRPGFLETSVHARNRRAVLLGAAHCLAIYSAISDAGVLSVMWRYDDRIHIILCLSPFFHTQQNSLSKRLSTSLMLEFFFIFPAKG